MKTILLTAVGITAVLSPPAMAETPAPTAPSNCYIEVQRLIANPGGIGELAAAIRLMDEQLQPQVNEVNRLKRLVETLDLQQQQAMQNAGPANEDAMPTAPATGDISRINEDLVRASTELAAKQEQLHADYDAQMHALLGPVQERVGQRAVAYGSQHGCAQVKMARGPDLAALHAAGAHDVTLDFVSWYPKS